MYSTVGEGEREHSLVSRLDQGTSHSPSSSVSPVDRPFTSHVRRDTSDVALDEGHYAQEGAHASPPPPLIPSSTTLCEKKNDEYGLQPPKLHLVTALYARDVPSGRKLAGVVTPLQQQRHLAQSQDPHNTSGPARSQYSLISEALDGRRHAPPRLPSSLNEGPSGVTARTYRAPGGRGVGGGDPQLSRAPEEAAEEAEEAEEAAEEAEEAAEAASLAALCATLPWWKLMLLHRGYRARVTELATTFYRAEMKVLAQTPELLSSAQGKDRLTGTVMAQYVSLPAGADWSVRHPRSLIQHSTLDTLRTVALHAMPPTVNPQQRMQQVAAVEHHLRTQRRASVLKTADMKKCDQKDVLAGRVPLPDPFDSEAESILARNAAALAGPPPVVTVGRARFAQAVGAPPPLDGPLVTISDRGSGVGAAGAETMYSFGESALSRRTRERAAELALYNFPSPPPSPRSRALGRKKGWSSDAIKETPYGTLVRSPSRLALGEAKAARAEKQRARDEALSAAFPSGGLNLSAEEHAERLAAEAIARVDGTNNLYGLSYYWDASFPPAGFIRESPEPRQAMWPDDVGDDARQLEEARKRREAETLVDRVNDRAKKLQYCHQYGLRTNMTKLLQAEEEDVERLNTVVEAETGAGAGGKKKAATRRGTLTDEARQLSSLTPTHDGPLHVNIVQHGEVVPHTSRATEDASPVGSSSASHPRPTRFLGTFRQSLFLVHFKLFCCALHEEQRLRRGGKGAHVSVLPIAAQLSDTHAASGTTVDYADETLLGEVPRIPTPVLRVQKSSPGLKKAGLRHTVQLEQAQAALCWEGLIPPLPRDPTNPAVHVWRYLHQTSFAARQSLRDIFNALDHDVDGRLVKQTFVEFVLDLLHLFFPTHLGDVHVAIAEEEWIYRGTTENVTFDVFFEKFFAFPFIFRRRIAEVTEDDYIEFWSLVRICLFESAASAPPLLSFEKVLMVPASASEVAAGAAGTLAKDRPTVVRSSALDTGVVEAAGAPMRIVKVTGTCTASAAEKMHAEKSQNMSRIFGANTSLSSLAASVQQQQEVSGNTSFETNAVLDQYGTTRSLGHISSQSGEGVGTGGVGSTPNVQSKAESMVALMQRERSALKEVQTAASQYAAAVADDVEGKSAIVMRAVFTEASAMGAQQGGPDGDDPGREAAADDADGPSTASPRARPRRGRRLSLLGPIMGVTPAQVLELYRCDYEHKEDYVLHQALSEVLRKDPVVRQLPPSRRYGVALSRGHQLVRARLDALYAAQDAAALVPAEIRRRPRESDRYDSIGVEELGDGLLHGAEGAGMQAALRQAVLQQRERQRQQEQTAARDGKGGGRTQRLQRIAEAVQLRRAVLRQLEEDRQLAQLLQNSHRYQDSKRRRQAWFNKAVAKVESTSSSWELHSDGVYDVTEPAPDVEARLLQYLSGVSMDVFDSRVSLRERFLVHERYLEERRRQGRGKTGLTLPPAGAVAVVGAARTCAVAVPPLTHSPTVPAIAGASASAGYSNGAGILGTGYGDTVILRAPAEAKTVTERLQRHEEEPTVEALYLASMDVAHQRDHLTRASPTVPADSAGEAARAVIVDDGAPAAEASTQGAHVPRGLGRRRPSSRYLTSYATGAYPVRPVRLSHAVYTDDETNGNGQEGAETSARQATVDRQAMIDALLQDSLFGPSDDTETSVVESTRFDSHRGTRGRGRRPRAPLSPLSRPGNGASAPVLGPSGTSEKGYTPTDLSDARFPTNSGLGFVRARARRVDSFSSLKRIPSSRSLPSVSRGTSEHPTAAAYTSATGSSRRARALAMEAGEGRAAATLLRRTLPQSPSQLGSRSSSPLSTFSSSSSSSHSSLGLPSLRNTGAAFVRDERGVDTRKDSSDAEKADKKQLDDAILRFDLPATSIASHPRATPTASVTFPEATYADDVRAAARLEKHTQALLDSLSSPIPHTHQSRVNKQKMSPPPSTATTVAASSCASQYTLEPHRPAFPFGATDVVSTRPHAAPSAQVARDAMTAAARILQAGDSARSYHDRYESVTPTDSARPRDVDLARRLASQRAREDRWARQQMQQQPSARAPARGMMSGARPLAATRSPTSGGGRTIGRL